MSPPVNPVNSDEKLPATVDVAVVGGGIIGCLSAYYLALKRLSVAVVEKGSIACEQSSRNWGWCRQTGRDTRALPLIRESLIPWAGLNEAVVIDVTDAIPDISPVETLPGFYLATGFSSHGFGIAPAAARLAADLITGDTGSSTPPLPLCPNDRWY